jgi:hypothetical protein
MNKATDFFVAAVAASTLAPTAVVASDDCPMCRAHIPFSTCLPSSIESPRGRSIGLVVKVLSSTRISHCRTRLSVEVQRASIQGLPSRIAVDVGPCYYWDGRDNDVINVLVSQRMGFEASIYQQNTCKQF